MAKQNVISKGRIIRMEQTTYDKFASKHFGVTRSHPVAKEVPIELIRIPKGVDIIKAVAQEPPEAPVVKEPTPVDSKIKEMVKPSAAKAAAKKK